MTRLCVALLARETRWMLERFAAHYRSIGFGQVVIYVDGEAGEAAGLVGNGIDVIACDAAFWSAEAGTRPDAVEMRQEAVFRHALRHCSGDWLFLPDADEFLVSDAPIAGLLETVPSETDVIRVANVEATWGPGDRFGEALGGTCFRREAESLTGRAIARYAYPRRVHALLQNGLAGHSSGKQFLRLGASYDHVKIHVTYRGDTPIGVWADTVFPAPVPFVAHFDAVSLDHWKAKFLRRQSGETVVIEARNRRVAQAQRIAESGAAAERLCRDLYGLSWAQFAVLRSAGLAFRRKGAVAPTTPTTPTPKQ